MTPFGISAPISRNFFGFLRKSTISSSSCFASLAPATSLKVTFFDVSFGSIMRALLLPNESACIPAPFTERVRNQMMIPRKRSGKRNGANTDIQYPKPVSRCTSMVICASCSLVTPRFVSVSETAASVSRLASPSLRVSSLYATSRRAPRTMISLTSPAFTCSTT